MFFFLSLDFWLGVVLGIAFTPMFVKLGKFVWSKFAAKAPAAAADVAAAAAVVETVAAPAVDAAAAAVESAIPTPPAK